MVMGTLFGQLQDTEVPGYIQGCADVTGRV